MEIQVRRVRGAAAVDVLSTKVSIDPSEYSARDGVINISNADLQEGDKLYVDVDQVHSTPAKGLTVSIEVA